MISVKFQYFIRAVILVVFAIFLIELHISGDITKYINPKYDGMSKIAAGVFILFFLHSAFSDLGEGGRLPSLLFTRLYSRPWVFWFLFQKVNELWYSYVSFIDGICVCSNRIGFNIAAKKGTVLPQVNRNENDGIENAVFENHLIGSMEEQEALPNNNFFSEGKYTQEMKKLDESELIQMNDGIYSSYVEAMNMNPNDFEGRKIKVRGFVYKEEGLEENQLILSRFLITHCIADASITGLITEFNQANEFEQDTWLEIEGTLEVTNYNGIELPLIKAEKMDRNKRACRAIYFSNINKSIVSKVFLKIFKMLLRILFCEI